MKDLKEIMAFIQAFAENHRMVNEFIYVGKAGELEQMTYKYRSFLIMLNNSRISRSENNPVYEMDLTVLLLDKTISGDMDAIIDSNQENLYIIGQLQDELQQFSDYDYDLSDVDQTPFEDGNYHITGASTVLTIRADRNIFIKNINKD